MGAFVLIPVERPYLVLAILIGAVLAYHVVPYFADPYDLRRYPGPFLAKFSRFWLGYVARHGERYKFIHALHQKYGPIVRISPEQISVADADAIQPVLGHGTGTVKSDFYDAFVSIHRGLFNTRSRIDHTRKRKIVSATFSPKNVLEFEPYIQSIVRSFLEQWDRLAEEAKNRGEKDGRAWFDCLPWLNYLAFDVIGDLAFGEPFHMIEKVADLAAVENEDGKVLYLPAVKILNERGEYSMTQGCLPPWIRPYTKYLDPWFARGCSSVANLAGIARSRVNKRLKEGAGDRKDLLARLHEGKDDQGLPMGKDELTAEALTQLIAGSDTTSNSSCAILWWIVKHPDVHRKLLVELDSHLGHVDGPVDYADCKDLPYLMACIEEALRRHSTSSIGLPRIMVEDIDFKGRVFKKGSVVSVPTYEVHHDESVYGDPWVYRPERWLNEDAKQLKKAFMPFRCVEISSHLSRPLIMLPFFSFGPRSCVGLNLAYLELLVFISTLILRYDIVLKDPDVTELDSKEGFLRKPLENWIGIKRRQKA